MLKKFLELMTVLTLITLALQFSAYQDAMAYDPAITDGMLYLNNGRPDLDGSIRFMVDPDTNMAEIEKLVSGVWQPAALELGSNTLWLGKTAAISAVGHHIITKGAAEGDMHMLPHADFNGSLMTSDVHVVDAYSYTERVEYQPDNTGAWSGTELNYSILSPAHLLIDDGYLQTGPTAATQNIRWTMRASDPDTGQVIFDQTYPASQFVADTEIQLDARGYIEFETGITYYHKISSTGTFSLKTNAAMTAPWLAADTSFVRMDNLIQTKPWVTGDTWTAGDYIIDSRKIYICNVTGAQTGTFASNASKWDAVSHVGNDLWTNTAGVLKNVAGPTAINLVSATTTIKPAAADRMRLSLNGLGLTYKGDVGYQLVLGIGQTTAYSPDQAISIDIANQQITMSDTGNGAGAVSLKYDKDTGFVTYSPDRTKSIAVSNAMIDNQTTFFNIGDGTRTRFDTKTDRTGLWGPNGSSNIVLSNTGTVITGPTTVCDGLGSNSLIVRPYSEHYSGGSITLVGADKNDEPLTYYENYHIDNFWGGMRIYTSGNSTKYIRLQNVSDIVTSPLKKLILEVSGNETIVGDQGFNATDETATLYLGNTNNYLQAIYDTGLELVADDDLNIVVDDNFTVKRGTQARVRVNYIETELISPAELYSIIVRDTYVNIWDSTKARLVLDLTTTKLVSGDGDQNFQVTNTGCVVSEDLVVTKWANIGAGLVLTPMTTTERDALTPVPGMMIYNSTTSQFQGYAGVSWTNF